MPKIRPAISLLAIFIVSAWVSREMYVDSQESQHVPLEVCFSEPVKVGGYSYIEGIGGLIVTEVENSTRCGPGVTAALAVRQAYYVPPK